MNSSVIIEPFTEITNIPIITLNYENTFSIQIPGEHCGFPEEPTHHLSLSTTATTRLHSGAIVEFSGTKYIASYQLSTHEQSLPRNRIKGVRIPSGTLVQQFRHTPEPLCDDIPANLTSGTYVKLSHDCFFLRLGSNNDPTKLPAGALLKII